MEENDPVELRRALSIALDGVTKLAERMTETIERVNTLSENDKSLEVRIENARGETFILLKVVADMLARECLLDRNPPARLDILLKRYFLAAEVFTPDPDDDSMNAELRKLGINIPEPTPAEKQEMEQDAAIAARYRDIANAIRNEAIKTIANS